MAANQNDTLLAFFECQCRGVKFYRLRDAALEYGSPVFFEREPRNPHDGCCVAVLASHPVAARGTLRMLGHLAREAAQWMTTLLLSNELFRVTGRIVSEPYSRAADGNRSWRYRVVDLHIFVDGPPSLLPKMPEFFEGAERDLHFLEFGPVMTEPCSSSICPNFPTSPLSPPSAHSLATSSCTPLSPHSPSFAHPLATSSCTPLPPRPLSSTHSLASSTHSLATSSTPCCFSSHRKYDILDELFCLSPTSSMVASPLSDPTCTSTSCKLPSSPTSTLLDELFPSPDSPTCTSSIPNELLPSSPSCRQDVPDITSPPPSSKTERDFLDELFFPPTP